MTTLSLEVRSESADVIVLQKRRDLVISLDSVYEVAIIEGVRKGQG